MNLDSLSPAERKELDVLVRRIAEAILRTLLAEVEDPIVRHMALALAAERLGLKVEA